MKILGINSYFEHPAVALIIDKELVFAVEDERLTRIKHGKKYTPYKTFIPIDAIYAALESQDLSISDIDEIAYSYNKWDHLKSIPGCFTGHRLSNIFEEIHGFISLFNIKSSLISGYEIPRKYRDRINPQAFKKINHREWNHHLSHAASAFYCSEKEQSLVFVIDGSGEKACSSVYIGKGKNLKKIKQISLPHSLGFFYSFITEHLGFEPFSDEYKVMGLAAFGEDSYAQEMNMLVIMSKAGDYKINIKLLKSLETILGNKRMAFEPLEQKHKNIAKSAQLCLEKVIESFVLTSIRETGIHDICLAGGTFLNILVNSRLAKLSEVNSIFVQPAAHDAGTAIGAAALSCIVHGGEPQIKFPSMFLGTQYSDVEIEQYLKQSNVSYEILKDAPVKIAKLLSEENIIALYRGRIEFGPRALGNRSLLASPKSERTRFKLNELKVREQFRPLAPLIPSEYFSDYFDGEANRYMMFAVNVKKEKAAEIPAVIHADGTARTQVIYKEHDPFMHSILIEYNKLQGIPILINTSLNVRGKPIDESPYDAMASFYTSGIDYLVMNNFIVKHPSKNKFI